MEVQVASERNHIHWFRKDLRLHDNPALLKSLENADNFFAIYVVDEAVISHGKTGANIWRFLIESLHCLNAQLETLNSRLFVIKGSILTVLPILFEEWGISRLTFTYDSEPYARQRDEIVLSLARSAKVEVIIETSHTLFDVNRYIESNKGNVPINFNEFNKLFSSFGLPPLPVEAVGFKHFERCVTPPVSSKLGANFGFPKLAVLGVGDSCDVRTLLHGGEDEGLKQYHQYKQQVSGTGKASEVVPFSQSSKLSSYFRFGCVSVRLVYHELHQLNSKLQDDQITMRELVMRDFFYTLASQISNWDKVDGNPLCLAIPWEDNDDRLTKFKEARTGFPWIDAIVTQLKQEGWVHDEARHALAHFLTRGYLWISWEQGVKFFHEYCIDADWSINAGNWLWASSSSFLNKHSRSYCPVAEGKRLDPSGTFIRKYLPTLRDIPDKYIYEPWKAPINVQRCAQCILGKDYPDRMIDHIEAKETCVKRLKEYQEELIHAMPVATSNVIHWFKKDLRTHDNPALIEAVRNGGKFYGVYVFDPINFSDAKFSINNARFLLQSLRDLDAKLRECGSMLCVVRGSPLHVFRQLFENWAITKLTMEEDTEPYGKKLDDSVASLAKKYDIQVVTKISHTLYSISEIIESNDSLAPFGFKRFISILKRIGQPREPAPALDSTIFYGCITPMVPDCHLPTLEEFGLNEQTYNGGTKFWIGGETEALRRFEILQKKLKGETLDMDTFQDITFPKVTSLSPYMRFGCISPRLMYHELVKIRKKVSDPQVPMNILMKLLFRDFLFTLGYRNFFFDKVNSNPVCLDLPWESNNEFITRWREAKTGFPWIDAVMTQLRLEGWANHLGRQAIACFLTRGCLWVSWEEGFKASQEFQLDFEWSLCAANWLMISCSSFFVRSDKYYCPVNTGKHVDPQGIFIRKYIPVLRDFPSEYIYDPWNAPIEVQKAAGCIIGEDYPMRVIDHEEARLVCANRLKEMVGELREGFSTVVSISEEEPQLKAKRMKTKHVNDAAIATSVF